MPHVSPYPNIEIPDLSLSAFVLEHAALFRDKPALIDGVTGRVVTYGQLTESVRALATGLHECGFGGGVCGIYSPNVPEYAIMFLAIARAGGIATTLSPLYTVAELTHQLRDSGARLVLTAPELLPFIRRATTTIGVERILTFGEGEAPESINQLLKHSRACDLPVRIDPRRNIVANVVQIQRAEGITSDDVLIATLPFHHIYGMVTVLNTALRSGATVVTLPRFETETFLRCIETYAVTTAYVVPPIVRMLATDASVAKHELGSLRHIVSGAASLRESLASQCEDRTGVRVRQAYGLTETSSITHIVPRTGRRLASVGVALPNTEFRVVDVSSGDDQAAGELGEVWVRGPQVMKGYLNDPEATLSVVDDDGWLHTGDIGFAERDGYLYVMNRGKRCHHVSRPLLWQTRAVGHHEG